MVVQVRLPSSDTRKLRKPPVQSKNVKSILSSLLCKLNVLSRDKDRIAAAAIETVVLHLQVVTAIVLSWAVIVTVTNANATAENALKTLLPSNADEATNSKSIRTEKIL